MTKIMIVDDDIETTTILESILKLEGFEPTSVNDSTLAIEKAELVHYSMRWFFIIKLSFKCNRNLFFIFHQAYVQF